MIPTEDTIKRAVAEELSNALEMIHGPLISPSQISVDLSDQENPVVNVRISLNIVKEDNYVGVCFY